jgi:hypothetical protein
VTLRASELDALASFAAERRQPEATAAAELVRAGLIDRGATLAAAVRRRTASAPDSRDRHGDGAADWLPPQRRAAAIEALRQRYPHELRHLRADALADPAAAEQAAALSLLRERIDDGRYDDPRIELAFAHELRAFSRWLQEHRLDRRHPRPGR